MSFTHKTARSITLLALISIVSGMHTAYAGTAYTVTDLGTLGGTYSNGFGINAAGQVVGVSDTILYKTTEHAFLYSNGMMTDLGTLGGTNSFGNGINDAGQVVGWSYTTGNQVQDAFVSSNGVMSDLNTLIDSNSGWQLTSAQGINNNGQITGYGTINGATHAFLLNAVSSAVPEPSQIASIGLGLLSLIGLGAFARRRKQTPTS